MTIYTAHEIWKAIHYTHPEKLKEEHGFTSETEFIMLKETKWRQ